MANWTPLLANVWDAARITKYIRRIYGVEPWRGSDRMQSHFQYDILHRVHARPLLWLDLQLTTERESESENESERERERERQRETEGQRERERERERENESEKAMADCQIDFNGDESLKTCQERKTFDGVFPLIALLNIHGTKSMSYLLCLTCQFEFL